MNTSETPIVRTNDNPLMSALIQIAAYPPASAKERAAAFHLRQRARVALLAWVGAPQEVISVVEGTTRYGGGVGRVDARVVCWLAEAFEQAAQLEIPLGHVERDLSTLKKSTPEEADAVWENNQHRVGRMIMDDAKESSWVRLQYVAIDKVEVIGEALTEPVYWTGRQWAVTAFGIEARNGTYPIPKDRVWEECNGDGWIEHMAEKAWVDMPDFTEALRLARWRWPA